MPVLLAPEDDNCVVEVPADSPTNVRGIIPAPESSVDYLADRAFAWGP